MSSQTLSQLLLIFFSSWSLTLIFLLMILLITHSQIASSVSGFKRSSNSFSYALEEQFKAMNIERLLLMFLDMLTVTQSHCKWFLVSFSAYIYTCCRFSKVLLRTRNLSSVSGFKLLIDFRLGCVFVTLHNKLPLIRMYLPCDSSKLWIILGVLENHHVIEI